MGISDLYKRIVGKGTTKEEVNLDTFLFQQNSAYMGQPIEEKGSEQNMDDTYMLGLGFDKLGNNRLK